MSLLTRRAAVAAALALTLPLAAGCGPPNGMPAAGEVTGTVTYNGRPLSGGTVVFHSVDEPGRNGAAIIKADGTYQVFDAPVGPNRVVVLPPDAAAPAADGKPGYASGSIPRRGVVSGAPADLKAKPTKSHPTRTKPPAKYGKPDSTPLTFDVERGKNDYDVTLSD